MTVSEIDVLRVAELANLDLTTAEKASMVRDLNSVLENFAQLNELDTTSISPMTQVSDQLLVAEMGSSLRVDEVAPSLSRDKVLACAPDTDGTFFKVPKVIER